MLVIVDSGMLDSFDINCNETKCKTSKVVRMKNILILLFLILTGQIFAQNRFETKDSYTINLYNRDSIKIDFPKPVANSTLIGVLKCKVHNDTLVIIAKTGLMMPKKLFNSIIISNDLRYIVFNSELFLIVFNDKIVPSWKNGNYILEKIE